MNGKIFNGRSNIILYERDATGEQHELGQVVADSLSILEEDDDSIDYATIVPETMSFSVNWRAKHSVERALMSLPPLHPDNIKHPNRKQKWRLRKKMV